MVSYCYIFIFVFLGATRVLLAPDHTALLVAVAVVCLSWAAVTDLKSRQIPNLLNLCFLATAMAATSLAALWGGDSWTLARAALAGLVLFAGFWAVHALSPQGLGGGDVKLAAALGVVLGSVSWAAVWQGIVLACLLNGLAGLWLWLASRSAQGSLPFAPALGSGTLLALLLAVT